METLERLEDLELIKLSNNDERAYEVLINRYKGMVIALSRKYYLQGGDIEDLISEGMIALYKAIKTYNEKENAQFSTYAYLLISRSLINEVVKSSSKKNTIINESLPITKIENYSGGINPEEVIAKEDEDLRFEMFLKDNLSKLEFNAIKLYLQGHTYEEIAEELNIEEKSVDNAISRGKKKIAKILEVK